MTGATATRPRLEDQRVTSNVAAKLAGRHPEILKDVMTAIERHDVVVVGMAQNPHVARVRKALTDGGIAHEYIGYGSYLSQWSERLTIKLWSGWPTFPQVFAKGKLIGGEDLTKAAIADGSLQAMLNE